MNREECLDWLCRLRSEIVVYMPKEWLIPMNNALEIAIKALKQEPCEDAISRSEAIRVASGYCHWSNIPDELAKLPSVNPIPCEDAISRHAVLNILDDMVKDYVKKNDFDKARGVAWVKVQKLPSVSTEKTGCWVEIDDEPHEVWECDHCGFVIDGSGCIDPYEYKDIYKYCPNCGAKMEVEE